MGDLIREEEWGGVIHTNCNEQKLRNSAKTYNLPNGSMIEWTNGDKFWYLNGKLHRTDGPAIEYVSGTKFWYQNGKYHRTDGPAKEYNDGTKEWYQNGLLHLIDYCNYLITK